MKTMQSNKSALFRCLLLAFCCRRDNSMALAFSMLSPLQQPFTNIASANAARDNTFRLSVSNTVEDYNESDDDDDARGGGGQRSLLSLDTPRTPDKSIMTSNRRGAMSSLLLWTGVAFVATTGAQPASAKDKGPPISQEEAFARVQRELTDGGAVAVLQAALNAGDYTQLMTLSRDMDLSLRKLVLVKAKAFVQDGEAGTMVCNAVTFDLIGINRNSRAGQENATQVQKYIDELKDDIQRMLTLERVPIEV